jgi:ABC-type nitrate/sulfonate/bicarbonate transport system substrate-binding protein
MHGTRWSVGLTLLVLLASCTASPSASPAPSAPGAATSPTSGAAAPPAAAPAPVPAAVKVRYGVQNGVVYAGAFIAADRGYFQEEGLDVDLIPFSSASEIIPALATDQLEAGGISTNPALWNAVARGVRLKAVLDIYTFIPGRPAMAVVVRKAAYDEGRVRRVEDLRGRAMAITPPGAGTLIGCALGNALKRVGMSLDDIDIQPLPITETLTALLNGAVDYASLGDPALTYAQREGAVVKILGMDEAFPYLTLGLAGFTPTFYEQREVGKRFVRAYLRAHRVYNDAIAGRTSEAERAAIEATIARFTGIDVTAVHDMVPIGMSPNGLPNRESQAACYQFFREQGLIPEPVPDAARDALWGTDLLEEVLAEIGRLPEN